MLKQAPDFKRHEAQIAELLAVAAHPWIEGRAHAGHWTAVSLAVINPFVAKLAIGAEVAGIESSLTAGQVDSLLGQRTASWGRLGDLLDLRRLYSGNLLSAMHALGVRLDGAGCTEHETTGLLAATAHLTAIENRIWVGARIEPLAAGFIEEYLVPHYRFHAVVMDVLAAR